jgi:hypothetical protein
MHFGRIAMLALRQADSLGSGPKQLFSQPDFPSRDAMRIVGNPIHVLSPANHLVRDTIQPGRNAVPAYRGAVPAYRSPERVSAEQIQVASHAIRRVKSRDPAGSHPMPVVRRPDSYGSNRVVPRRDRLTPRSRLVQFVSRTTPVGRSRV